MTETAGVFRWLSAFDLAMNSARWMLKLDLRPGRVLRACYPLDEAEQAFRAAREVAGKTWIRF